MTDTDDIAPEDEGRVIAAEYVLGVLSIDEHRAIETRMAAEPALGQEIAFWEERLGGMASFVKSVPPPARMWLRIEAAVSAPPPRERPASIWDSLLFWRLFAVGASAVAAACLAGLVYVAAIAPPRQPRDPMLATLSNTQSKQPNFVAAISGDGTSLTIMPAALLTADKHSMELWLIPQGGQPHSLGLISAGQPVRMTLPREMIAQLGAGTILAVSLEPPGGSPTGKPTGEVIAAGPLTRL